MVLVRQEIGDVLRDFRLQKGHTLRQVAGRASVALGYLSEVERGQKEASSEILASVADALDTPISVIMHEVGDRMAIIEGLNVIPTRFPRTSVPHSASAISRASVPLRSLRGSRSADRRLLIGPLLIGIWSHRPNNDTASPDARLARAGHPSSGRPRLGGGCARAASRG